MRIPIDAPLLKVKCFVFTNMILNASIVQDAARGWFVGLGNAVGYGLHLAPAGPAASEKVIAHARIREMTGLHPFDATRLLQNLVRDGFLEPHNPGRGAVYCLPGASLPKPEEVFGGSSAQSVVSSAHLTASSAHLAAPVVPVAEQRDTGGCLLSGQLDAPVIDALARLTPEFRSLLEVLSTEPRAKGKLSADAMRRTILALCTGHYVALSSLAELVNRDTDALRQQHLKPLIKEGKLRLAFPTVPTHAKQAYRAVE